MGTAAFTGRVSNSAVGPVPDTGNPTLEAFIAEELLRIQIQMELGMFQMLSMAVNGREPPNLFDGLVMFFRENTVGPQPQKRGLYVWHDGAWEFIA